MYDRNALRRYLEAGGRPEDLGMSVDQLTGDMQEPAPTGNALRAMMDQSQGNVMVAPQSYNMSGNAVPTINGDFQVFPGKDQPQSVDLTPAVQQAAQQRMAQPQVSGQAQGPMGGPMRVVGAGNGTTVELSPEVAPAKVDLDYSRPPVDVPGVGKVYYDKSGRGAYAVDGSGRPTAKVLLGYDMQASMDLTKKNTDLAKTRAEIAHTDAATAELGAPKYQLTTEGDVFNTKTGQITSTAAQPGQTQRNMQKAAYQAGVKQIGEDEKQSENLPALEAAYNRWLELNQKVTTGRLSGMINPLLAISNPERQEMEKLQSYLAMNNFKPGQGSMSNFERQLIQKGGPNLSNDPEANTDIVKASQAQIQNQRDRLNFRQQYLQTHGSLMGADLAWQQYTADNPTVIQDPKTGRVLDNPNRVSWQQYFSGGTPDQPARPMSAQRPTSTPQPMQSPVVMPKSKAQLVVGQTYQTARGPARWNGTAFEQ